MGCAWSASSRGSGGRGLHGRARDYIVTASEDKTARVWDAESGREVRALKGHTGIVTSASFSPDEACVVTSSYDKSAILWDAKSGKQAFTLKGHTNWVESASFSPDSSRVRGSYPG